MSLFADPRNPDEKACHNLLSASWSAQLSVRPHNHVRIPPYSLASPVVMDHTPLNHEPGRPFLLYVALAKCFTTAMRKVAKILDNSIIKSPRILLLQLSALQRACSEDSLCIPMGRGCCLYTDNIVSAQEVPSTHTLSLHRVMLISDGTNGTLLENSVG